MAILSTYKNELGIALCLSEKWPKEQRELLILEAKAMKAGREQKERAIHNAISTLDNQYKQKC